MLLADIVSKRAPVSIGLLDVAGSDWFSRLPSPSREPITPNAHPRSVRLLRVPFAYAQDPSGWLLRGIL